MRGQADVAALLRGGLYPPTLLSPLPVCRLGSDTLPRSRFNLTEGKPPQQEERQLSVTPTRRPASGMHLQRRSRTRRRRQGWRWETSPLRQLSEKLLTAKFIGPLWKHGFGGAAGEGPRSASALYYPTARGRKSWGLSPPHLITTALRLTAASGTCTPRPRPCYAALETSAVESATYFKLRAKNQCQEQAKQRPKSPASRYPCCSDPCSHAGYKSPFSNSPRRAKVTTSACHEKQTHKS